MKKYLNLKDFTVTDMPSGYICCDEEIIESVVELIKKDYEISSCFAGEIKDALVGKLECPAKDFGDFRTMPVIKILEETTDKIIYTHEWLGTMVAINFKEDYSFDELPKGFKLSKGVQGTSLTKEINYYRDETYNDKKTNEEIISELEESRKDLLTWAKKL